MPAMTGPKTGLGGGSEPSSVGTYVPIIEILSIILNFFCIIKCPLSNKRVGDSDRGVMELLRRSGFRLAGKLAAVVT